MINATQLELPDPERTYRIVQWASGRAGCSAARGVIGHPQMELVGMWVHSSQKAGKDAGVLCGLDPIGICATQDIEEVIALEPDCLLYMQEGCDIDDVCRILEAGINVITTRGEFHFPPLMEPELRRRTEDACAKGGSSIHSSGVSPGFVTEALPLLLASVSRRIDRIVIDEYANLVSATTAETLIDVLGYGRSATAEFDPNLLAHLSQNFAQSLGVVADAIGMPFDEIKTHGEVALARQPILLDGGRVIEEGTVASQRMTLSGMHKGQALISMRLIWYCSTDTNPAWKTQESGWRILVEGDAPFDISITFPETEEARSAQMAGYSCYRIVNEIPYVCAAPPGIVTSAQLPPDHTYTSVVNTKFYGRSSDRCDDRVYPAQHLQLFYGQENE